MNHVVGSERCPVKLGDPGYAEASGSQGSKNNTTQPNTTQHGHALSRSVDWAWAWARRKASVFRFWFLFLFLFFHFWKARAGLLRTACMYTSTSQGLLGPCLGDGEQTKKTVRRLILPSKSLLEKNQKKLVFCPRFSVMLCGGKPSSKSGGERSRVGRNC